MPLQSPLLNHLKRWARAHVPPRLRRPVASGVATVQRRLGRDQRRLEDLARRHHALNGGLGPDRIVLRKHIALNIHPDSRDPFEHFCFRSLEMNKEMDFFIRVMSDKKFFIDIGSLHGIFSLVFCHGRSANAVALEPSPLAFPKLLYNIESNALPIEALNIAASDRSGSIIMELDWEHLVAFTSDDRNEADRAVHHVRAEKADDVIIQNDYPVDLIKIDVEGHEGAVVRGLRTTLEERAPDVFIEMHPMLLEQAGESVADVVGTLTSCGYALTDLDGRAVLPERLHRQADVFRVFARRG